MTFPIRDPAGRVVSFGGRALGDATPKYLNGPETRVYDKGRVLYRVHEEGKALRESRRAVLVEGYFDALGLARAGVGGAVAVCGTAFGEGHARLLARFCETVVLVFDGDPAGWKAAERALDIFAPSPLDVRVVLLEGGRDPADLVRREGGAALEERVKEAPSAFEVKLDLVLGRNDHRDPAGAARAAGEIVEYLGKVGDPVRRERLLLQGASRLGVSPRALGAALEKALRRERRRRPSDGKRAKEPFQVPPAEAVEVRAQEEILWAVLHDLSLLGEVAPERFRDPGCRKILEGIFSAVESMEEEGSFPWETLIDAVREDQSLVDKIAFWRNVAPRVKDLSQWVKQNDRTLRKLEDERVLGSLEDQLRKAKEAEDPGRVLQFRRKKYELIRKMKMEYGMGMEE